MDTATRTQHRREQRIRKRERERKARVAAFDAAQKKPDKVAPDTFYMPGVLAAGADAADIRTAVINLEMSRNGRTGNAAQMLGEDRAYTPGDSDESSTGHRGDGYAWRGPLFGLPFGYTVHNTTVRKPKPCTWLRPGYWHNPFLDGHSKIPRKGAKVINGVRTLGEAIFVGLPGPRVGFAPVHVPFNGISASGSELAARARRKIEPYSAWDAQPMPPLLGLSNELDPFREYGKVARWSAGIASVGAQRAWREFTPCTTRPLHPSIEQVGDIHPTVTTLQRVNELYGGDATMEAAADFRVGGVKGRAWLVRGYIHPGALLAGRRTRVYVLASRIDKTMWRDWEIFFPP